MRVLGFMSGTSLDGVDAAIIETDGDVVTGFGPALLMPFSEAERTLLKTATEATLAADAYDPAALADADALVVEAHVRCARHLLADPDAGKIDLIGFHGQTVLHRPERRLTVQIGSPLALALALGIDVIGDVRQADIAAGGQGAPLVPIYHAGLARYIGAKRPVAFLNIGGVANVTALTADGAMLAFDTGPGNGLIDLVMQARGAGRYDEDGRHAAAGRVDNGVLRTLLDSPYFTMAGPKSLDRYDFPLAAVDALSLEDAAATLVAFTAEAVALAARRLPELPSRWIICGGGRRNPVLMQALRDRVGQCDDADDLGLRGDFIEAEMMAYVAARAVRGLPITFPGTTGAPEPMTGGKLYRTV